MTKKEEIAALRTSVKSLLDIVMRSDASAVRGWTLAQVRSQVDAAATILAATEPAEAK